MSVNKYLEALGMPFPADKVKWRLQSTNKDKTEGYAVPYLDSRAIAERLDNVVGQMNWRDEYKPWANTKEGASQLCTIYIYDEERKEWIGKTDGASMSQIEPVKGGISDAFKRAAVKWNIGRYLYRFQVVKVRTGFLQISRLCLPRRHRQYRRRQHRHLLLQAPQSMKFSV